MMRVGMVGCRLDLTWGSVDFHAQTFRNIQAAMSTERRLCCTIVDTAGRELMIRHDMSQEVAPHETHETPFTINKGDIVTITTRTDLSGLPTELNVSYPNFPSMTEPGDLIYIGRYLTCGAENASLYVQVLEVRGTDVLCEAHNTATMEGMLTAFHIERSAEAAVCNLQNTMPVLSDRDKIYIQALNKDFDIDFVCISYARDGSDLREVRTWLDSVGMSDTKILAKISTRQSLVALQPIINAADGVVLSRGTLGLDNYPEKMALIQKMVIKACNLVGKPVLITRVVDTMISAPRPTRAEATDVANAVLDGADGFMLGAETFRGMHAVPTVKTISTISRAAERVFDHHYHCDHLMEMAQSVASMQSSASSRTFSTVASSDDIRSNHGDEMAAGHSPPRSGSRLGPSGGKGMPKVGSIGGRMNMEAIATNMAGFGMGDSMADNIDDVETHAPIKKTVATNLEAMCSSAVRCADKVQASLIVVYTNTGETAQLVAKYRPDMPILALVVPHLVSNSNRWQLMGKQSARQLLLTRGLLPMLAAPGHTEDAMLEDAVRFAAKLQLVKEHQFVVCIQRVHTDVVVKVVNVDAVGQVRQPINEASSFVQLPGIYSRKGQPLTQPDSSTDLFRQPQVLGHSLSMMPHAWSLNGESLGPASLVGVSSPLSSPRK